LALAVIVAFGLVLALHFEAWHCPVAVCSACRARALGSHALLRR
jgi:hypothetical protein